MPLALLLAATATVVQPGQPLPGACDAASTDEIVVCKRAIDPARYRLPALTPADATGPPHTEWSLGGNVRAGVAVSSAAMPQGAVSQRVMATIKLPF